MSMASVFQEAANSPLDIVVMLIMHPTENNVWVPLEQNAPLGIPWAPPSWQALAQPHCHRWPSDIWNDIRR